MNAKEKIEFAFPNLRSNKRQLSKQPYAYVLTSSQDEYIRTFPNLLHVAFYFGISCYHKSQYDYLIRVIWDDNRAYFVPYDLIFGENGLLLSDEEIPEHFLERGLEDYLVQHFLENEKLNAKGLPEQWSAASDSYHNYKNPPECIPKIGWVDESYPLHSANKK